MVKIKIRLAREKDCKELSLLKIKMWQNTYKNIYPQKKLDEYNINLNEIKFKALIKKNTQKLYVVLEDKKIIGYMSFGEILRPFENYTHDIGLLYILKEYQGMGLGKKLFNFAKNELKKLGLEKFIISCNKYNLHSQEFYKKMGGKIIQIDEDNINKSIPQIKFLFEIEKYPV